jgi:3-phosphoshikimate 1-carboxyvinyltransferase
VTVHHQTGSAGQQADAAGEPRGTVIVEGDRIGRIDITPEEVPGLIDELPAIAALAGHGAEVSVRGAAELRVKETDRIATLVENFRRMGIDAEASPDGLIVPGCQPFRAAAFDSFGDHRIAMAFAVAALRGDGESTIDNANSAAVSFPGFFSILRQISVQ